jgi:hypothetical protein
MVPNVVALLLWLCIVSCTPTPSAWATEGETTILALSGNGTRNTRPFTVKAHWEIRWSTPNSTLIISVYRADPKNELDAIAVGSASQLKPGDGDSYFDAGGRYYLNIAGTGDWTVIVVQLP